ncbi:porin family protein [Billgrantia kenyensis]|uniref:Porin family protein n=1 Tax=Billgrantia kenyensis TaxID=321266 RepID=A0A7V9VY86_9GAMM|nr:porin family protein [Halomonas kenyensis]MBA2777618.1 porin family protein [Halomonas kenyensis]MCG6660288.1 porin family protein [Halomonas kenyensis]
MSNRTLLCVSLSAASLLIASGAQAQTHYEPHERYAYLGLGTGFSSLENDRDEVDNFIESGGRNFSIDDDGNVWKGFAGYQFNRYLAVEAFYADLGRVRLRGTDGASADLESTAYGASVVGQLPVTDWFTPFAKIGAASWETEVRGNLGDTDLTLQDNDGFDPVYGLGAQFNINPILIRAEYERYDFDSDYTIDTFTASVGLRF